VATAAKERVLRTPGVLRGLADTVVLHRECEENSGWSGEGKSAAALGLGDTPRQTAIGGAERLPTHLHPHVFPDPDRLLTRIPSEFAAASGAEPVRLRVVPLHGPAWRVFPTFAPRWGALPAMAATPTDRVVAFVPTGWAQDNGKSRRGGGSVEHEFAGLPEAAAGMRWRNEREVGGVVDEIHCVGYSEHSSWAEVRDFVALVRPRKVVPHSAGGSYAEVVKGLSDLLDSVANKRAFVQSMVARAAGKKDDGSGPAGSVIGLAAPLPSGAPSSSNGKRKERAAAGVLSIGTAKKARGKSGASGKEDEKLRQKKISSYFSRAERVTPVKKSEPRQTSIASFFRSSSPAEKMNRKGGSEVVDLED